MTPDAGDRGTSSGNNSCTRFFFSCPAGGTYNSITCSFTANDFVPLVCGSLEQNRRHGWPACALPRSLLPPPMTSQTSTLQNVSILTSHLSTHIVVLVLQICTVNPPDVEVLFYSEPFFFFYICMTKFVSCTSVPEG